LAAVAASASALISWSLSMVSLETCGGSKA
jgi:hypothetical protein